MLWLQAQGNVLDSLQRYSAVIHSNTLPHMKRLWVGHFQTCVIPEQGDRLYAHRQLERDQHLCPIAASTWQPKLLDYKQSVNYLMQPFGPPKANSHGIHTTCLQDHLLDQCQSAKEFVRHSSFGVKNQQRCWWCYKVAQSYDCFPGTEILQHTVSQSYIEVLCQHNYSRYTLQ